MWSNSGQMLLNFSRQTLQKDFLNMKSHSPADAKLLMGGVKGLIDSWRLGVLHVEYERLKKNKCDKIKRLSVRIRYFWI